jgi:hypothetical protein
MYLTSFTKAHDLSSNELSCTNFSKSKKKRLTINKKYVITSISSDEKPRVRFRKLG